MKRFYTLLIAFFFLILSGKINAQVPVVTITQVDTFAISGMALQPVLRIKITTSDALQTLQKIGIKTLCDTVSDIDSIAIFQSTSSKFITYPDVGVFWLTSKNRKIAGDTVLFDNMTQKLVLGDNYIWVIMNLSSKSVSGHNIDAEILKNRIQISGLTYPNVDVSPANSVQIRKKYYSENFEHFNNSIDRFPLNWGQEQLSIFNYNWTCQKGGYQNNPGDAISGKYNAQIIGLSQINRGATILKSPLIDLSLAVKPMLTFYQAQMQWCKSTCSSTDYNDTDSLGVYFKLGVAGSWKFLQHYNLPTPNSQWSKREIILPDEALKPNVILGFKGNVQDGFGVCLDSIVIYEAGVLPREINSIVTTNPYNNFVPQGQTKVAVSRTDIRVKGNTNTILLNSFTATSANSSDNDVLPSSVKLWYTSDSLFVAPVLIGTNQTFVAGKAIFGALNKKLETGDNFFWITYDISGTATPTNTLNVSIKTGSLILNIAGTFPASDQQPSNSLIIKQSIFFDDFETDKLWTLTGDFQRNTPTSKGGGVNSGFPDPPLAYSGSNVLGNDLTGILPNNGNYENNITYAAANTATTNLISCKYFKNTELFFKKWLNVELQDSAVIEYKFTGDPAWHFLWKNKIITTDNTWQPFYNNTKKIFDRKDFTLRFRLGPTNSQNNYSGWNIDDLFLTGDTIKHDASITQYISPTTACGLTANEFVKVTVKNTGPKVLTNIPIKLSKDGGLTWITETIPGSLAVDNSIDYTFTTPTDLSKPAIYNIIVKTVYPTDDYLLNDSVIYKLTSVPTYSLPFKTDFEQDTTFWLSGGLNSSWNHGFPNGSYIHNAASGNYCWKTDTLGTHNLNENSYLESPCFNLNNNDVPLIDIKYSYYTAAKTDGSKLSYSTDGGSSWNYFPKDTYSFAWPWYTDTIHAYKGVKGWTGQTIVGGVQKWINGIQALPPSLANNPKVKFRFEFKSDSSIVYKLDGFAFDDFKLYNAPYNVGTVSIDNLNTTACENTNPQNLNITVKNLGIRDVRLNDTIIIGVKINNNLPVIDTFKLTSPLAVNASRQFTMSKKVNLNLQGNYQIKVYTLIEKNPLFYGPNNDTTKLDVLVNPNPIVNLKDTIYTGRKDTLLLHAPFNLNCDYNWTDKFSHVSLFQDFDVQQFGWQNLKVTNSITGCFTKDSTFIKQLIPDIGVSKILSPFNDSCSYGSAFHPIIEITNFGTDTIQKNHKIPVSIKLIGNSELSDTIVAPIKFAPGDKLVQTLNKSIDLTAPLNNKIIITTNLPYDIYQNNDTAKRSFQIFGNPAINLGPDRHISSDTYILDPGPDPNIVSYLWNTGDQTQSILLTNVGLFSVIVKNAHGCANTDTVNIWMKIHNLSISQVANLNTTCDIPKDTVISCYLKNKGTDTIYMTEPIIMGYSINDSAFRNEQNPYYVPHTLYPNDSVLYIFNRKINLHIPAQYKIKVSAILGGDNRPFDDTIVHHMEIYGNPVLNLGSNRTVYAVSETLQPGVGSLTYKWQDNSTDPTYVIDRSHFESSHIYSVTAQNIHGCTSSASVLIYLKVRDIGVSALRNVFDACVMPDSTIVKMKIKNMGTDTIPANLPLNISYSVNGGTVVTENVTLPAIMYPNDTIKVVFFKKASFKTIGTYKILLKSVLAGDIDVSNDTLSRTISVFGNPQIELGPTRAPNTYSYTVRTNADRPIVSYLWQDGSTDSTYIITKRHYQHGGNGTPNKYIVTVTDQNGCQSTDNAFIILVDDDLEITNIAAPITSCTLTDQERVAVKITNVGNTKLTNRSIDVSYKINNSILTTKTFVFSGDSSTSSIFIFPNLEDFSAIKNYKINAQLSFVGDVQHSNDTISSLVRVTGNPTASFDATNDSIHVNSYPYTLIPITAPDTSTFQYFWSTGELTSTANITEDGGYLLNIVDINNCSATTNVVYIQKDITNLGVAGFSFPTGMCKTPSDTTVNILIANKGNKRINNASITIQYQLDNGAINTKNVLFSGKSNDTLSYKFDERVNMSTSGIYTFKGGLTFANDAVPDDNLKEYDVTVYEDANVSFKGIVDGSTRVPELPYVLDPGTSFSSYLWQDGSTTQTFTVPYFGTYSVTIVDSHNCKSTKTIIIDGFVGLETAAVEDDVQFYPNPAKDIINYKIKPQDNEKIMVEILSSDGKVELRKILSGESLYKGIINVESLAKGMYYIRIIQKGIPSISKLVIE